MFYDLKYEPSKDDVIAKFRLEAKNFRKAAENVAIESSVGTWTPVKTFKKRIEKLEATVFKVRKPYIYVAYPIELFEAGNISQLLSSVAGNIFGMKLLDNLRLEDIHLPRKYVKAFKGPRFGIKGIRKYVGTRERPHIGTIVKPKMGLTPKETAEVASLAWEGGLDLVKDDENLTTHKFCKFEERVKRVLEAKFRIEDRTGESKMYCANITGPVDAMIKRAEFVRDNGGNTIMIDVITAGFSAVQYIRELFPDMMIHAHRAMHAAITRNHKHGVSMLVLAKLLRLAGVDQLHIGTAVGKMEGDAKEVRQIKDEITLDKVGKPLEQEWFKMEPVFPVTSGGLCPLHVPELIKLFGTDIVIQAGGGVHGHPSGTLAGAKAMRQAVDAVMAGIPLKEYAKTHKELEEAIGKWG